MARLWERVAGALRLRPETFEEVEHDVAGTPQAVLVVLLVALSDALGAAAWWRTGIASFLLTVLVTFTGWLLAAAVLWFVGTRLLPGKNTEADYGQVLRVTAFAEAPGLFYASGMIPLLGSYIRFLLLLWSLIALVIGVKQALDYEATSRAVVVCIVAWGLQLLFVIAAALLESGIAFAVSGTGGR